jgi:hypothetical protein
MRSNLVREAFEDNVMALSQTLLYRTSLQSVEGNKQTLKRLISPGGKDYCRTISINLPRNYGKNANNLLCLT